MRMGRLSISRGHRFGESADESPPRLALVRQPDEPAPVAAPAPPEAAKPAAVSPDYHLVHDRLTSLERLTRLFELGALSAEEFAAEKTLILALPADELVLRDSAPVHFVPAAPRRPQRGPSLVGRMLSWQFLLVSLILGLGFSFVAQPDQTLRFFDQSLRYFGV